MHLLRTKFLFIVLLLGLFLPSSALAQSNFLEPQSGNRIIEDSTSPSQSANLDSNSGQFSAAPIYAIAFFGMLGIAGFAAWNAFFKNSETKKITDDIQEF